MEPDVDVAILGAGQAGLLACRALVRAPGFQGTVRLVEPSTGKARDHAVAWWTTGPGDPSADVAPELRWPRLRVRGPGGEPVVDLAPGAYQAILRESLRARLLAEVLDDPRVSLQRGRAGAVDDEGDRARVHTDTGAFTARWVLDGRWTLPDPPAPPHTLLYQSFRGGWVRSETPRFDPTCPTLMDLLDTTDDGLSFTYVLPVDAHTAFVEQVTLADRPLRVDPGRWLRRAGLTEAAWEPTEQGVTPMTDRPWPRRLGPRHVAVGILGGRLKPSTGYAFARMVEDAEALATSMVRHGHPLDLPATRWPHAWLDAVMLRVLRDDPRGAARALTALFARVPGPVLLRFLAERASWAEILRVGWALPWRTVFRGVLAWLRERLQ